MLGERLIPKERLPLSSVEDKTDPTPRMLVVEDRGNDAQTVSTPPSNRPLPAQPGDTILIRQDGELAVDPIALNKKTLSDLTIRPPRGFRPVLTLGESAASETALFRVQDGKFRLEGLGFRIYPTKGLPVAGGRGDGVMASANAQILRHAGGNRANGCRSGLADCQADRKTEMKLNMTPIRTEAQGPKLLLENTFVRGDGDLFLTKTSRPCELALKNSLAALSGSLFHLEVANDATKAPIRAR